jgi:hypothetical protein
MRELPRTNNATMDHYREEVTDDTGNEQVHVNDKDAKKIAETSQHVEVSDKEKTEKAGS